MATIPLGDLNHHPSKVTARVRAGETVVITDHGKPVIQMTPAADSTSVIDEMLTAGLIRRTAHPGAMPELVDDLAELPSLSDALIAERDRERNQ